MSSGIEHSEAILPGQVRSEQADRGEGDRAVSQALEDSRNPPRRAGGSMRP
jgi:hypothetical protein